jgi:MraZ protein
MYFGLYTVRLRAKNRLAFPAKLKKETGNTLLITNWFENSLLVLPKNEWEQLVKDIFEKASFLLPDVRDLDRFIYGGTYEVELDGEARFVLPAYLKEYAQIKDEVVITGGAWYITLWDKAHFEAYRALNTMQVKDKAVKVFENITKKTT